MCRLTGSGRLKWRIIIPSDGLSCLYPLWRRVKWEERELLLLWPWWVLFSDAVSTALHHSFYAYPTLEVKFLLSVGSLQKRRISQHFSLSLSVIRNRLCLLSFSFKTKRRSTALSFPFLIWWWFQSDLSAAVDVWPIVLASVSKCFWQVSVKDRPQG